MAADDISSTRSEAAESAVATKATLTAGRTSLHNGDGSGCAHGTLSRQQHRLSKYHYSCEAVSGIDGASEEREDGAIGCMYCGRSFAHDDETTIHRLGFHIVRAHGFGLCNLNCTFETRSELLDHLKSFHAWSRGGRGDQDETEEAILDRYFLMQKRSTPRCTRLLDLEDGDVQAPRGMRGDGEETGLLNLLVLNEILRVANLDVKMDEPRPSTTTVDPGETQLAHELCVALSQLDRLTIDANANATSAATAGASNGSTSVAATEREKGQTTSNGQGTAGLKMEVDLDELLYHAACVQQELAVSSGGEDVLRHEALYSADQYRIDDLVCMYFPPRASPDRHRAWYVRPVEAGPGVPASIVTAFNDSLKGLGLTKLEPAGPLRTFRDAIRALGRAHMETTGAKTYIAIMPQLLRVSKILLRQDRRPPAAPTHSLGWDSGVPRQTRMLPIRSNTMPLLHQPMHSRSQQRLREEEQGQQELRAANLALLMQIQQRDAHRPATTTRERRLRWITDGGLDWWFLGMLERSASFRRLVRSGKAIPAPSNRKPRSKTGDSSSVTADASKTRLAPYAWAVALLSSAGLPHGGGQRNGRSNIDRPIASGNGSRAGSNGDLSRTLCNPRGHASAAVSLNKGDRGPGSARSVGVNNYRQQAGQPQQPRQQPSQQQPLQAQRGRQEADQPTPNGKGKEREGIVGQGLQATLSTEAKAEETEEDDENDDNDDNDEEDNDNDEGKDEDDEISLDEDSWESSSSR